MITLGVTCLLQGLCCVPSLSQVLYKQLCQHLIAPGASRDVLTGFECQSPGKGFFGSCSLKFPVCCGVGEKLEAEELWGSEGFGVGHACSK